MVLATLFEQFGNSERGLLRREIPGIYAREFYRLPLSDDTKNSQNEDASSFLPATKPKRKRCRASKFLSSVAADFDVVTDWLFYYHTCKYRQIHHVFFFFFLFLFFFFFLINLFFLALKSMQRQRVSFQFFAKSSGGKNTISYTPIFDMDNSYCLYYWNNNVACSSHGWSNNCSDP